MATQEEIDRLLEEQNSTGVLPMPGRYDVLSSGGVKKAPVTAEKIKEWYDVANPYDMFQYKPGKKILYREEMLRELLQQLQMQQLEKENELNKEDKMLAPSLKFVRNGMEQSRAPASLPLENMLTISTDPDTNVALAASKMNIPPAVMANMLNMSTTPAETSIQKPVIANPNKVTYEQEQERKRQEEASQQDTGKSILTQRLPVTEQTLADLEAIRSLPEFKTQLGDIDSLKRDRELLARMKLPNDAWIKPLLALAGAETGKNLMPGYDQGMTNEEKYKTLLAYDKEISGKNSALAKELLAAQKELSPGTTVSATGFTNVQKQGNVGTDIIKSMEGKVPEKETPPKTVGEDALDRTFAKRYDEWTSGGEATASAALEKLTEAKKSLEGGGAKGFGGLPEKVSGKLPNILQPNAAVELKENIHAAAVKGLRATLGPQFTEREGEIMKEYDYDPTLGVEENAKKLKNLYNRIKIEMENNNRKAAYWEANGGSLKGYKSPRVDKKKELEIHEVDPAMEAKRKRYEELRKKAGK